jgi:hypothetical protein
MNSVFDLIRNLRIAPHPGRRCPLPLGGEEFLLIMPGASMDIVRARAEEIRLAGRRKIIDERVEIRGTFSRFSGFHVFFVFFVRVPALSANSAQPLALGAKKRPWDRPRPD